jgi:type II secretory pathway pseudopilin PulG
MKLHPRQTNGWTLIELLVLIAILAVIFSLVPCAPRGARTRARQVACLNNLKQIAFANLIYAAEHDGKLPFEISTNRSGTKEWTNSPEVFRHFLVLSNELLQSPKVLACPADRQRSRTTDFASLGNDKISYFLCLDGATNRPGVLLAGDRNVSGGTAINANTILLRTNSPVRWTKGIHTSAGNVALVDGSVYRVDDRGLRTQLAAMTNEQIRLAIP